MVPQAQDEQLGRKRLRGVPGRALRLAPSALGARAEVEQTLPGELLHLRDAELVLLGVGLLEVERLALAHHRLQRSEARSGRPSRVALEEDVRERQESVPG